MHGPAQRLIKAQGTDYTIRNASGGGGRDVPNYSDDGTLRGVLEERGQPTTMRDSSGEEVESALQIRAVYDSSTTTIREAGSSGGYPTRLEHPDGFTYEVLAIHPEDSGVTVLTVHRI